ncbi:MAG: sugar ABC transporter substrate-binding protein [Clostridiales bacterium]|nr:sugar ABC transporter substrate-binding protein [Clostridiales bacterium]
MIIIGNLIILASIICFCGYKIYQKNHSIVLEFGMFAGSNWDVANANSYVIIDKVIAQFEAEHPGVKVHYTSGIRKTDYSEWYAQQVLIGKTPDVAMILSDDFDKLVSLDVLENLDDMADNDSSFHAEDYYTTALNTGKYRGAQYALPYETVPTLMFVNKSLLNHEGFMVPESDWTWDDMYDICSKITKDLNKDGIIDQFGTCNYSWQEAAYSNGAVLFDEDGKECYFTDQRVIDSVKFAKKLSDLNQGQNVSQDKFDAGNVAFMPLTFADYRTYKTYPYKIKKYSTFKWDCITLPSGPEGDNVSEVNTLLMGIAKQSKHKDLAWELLKLFTYDKDIQLDIFRYSQGASVLKSVTSSKEAEVILSEDTDERERVIDNTLLDVVIEKGIIAPKFNKYHETMILAEGEINKILSDDKNVESTLKIIQRNVISFLKQ